MLAGDYPGEGYRAGHAVGEQLGSPSGIFGGDDAGEAPAVDAVFRWRTICAEEWSLVCRHGDAYEDIERCSVTTIER